MLCLQKDSMNGKFFLFTGLVLTILMNVVKPISPKERFRCAHCKRRRLYLHNAATLWDRFGNPIRYCKDCKDKMNLPPPKSKPLFNQNDLAYLRDEGLKLEKWIFQQFPKGKRPNTVCGLRLIPELSKKQSGKHTITTDLYCTALPVANISKHSN